MRRMIWVHARNVLTKPDVDELLTRITRDKFTDLLVWNRADDGAMIYDSSLFRTTGARIDGSYPFAYVLEAAHGQGLKVHMWFTVGDAGNWRGKREPLPDEWLFNKIERGVPVNKLWLRLNLPEVRQVCLDWVAEAIAAHPELDGIHLDYIRYPTYSYKWIDEYGGIAAADITTLVGQVRAILELSSRLRRYELTAAVMTEKAEGALQHWWVWLKGELVDAVAMMLYDRPPLWLPRLDWIKTNLVELNGVSQRRVCSGIHVYPDGTDNPPMAADEFKTEIETMESGWGGWSVFAYGRLRREDAWYLLDEIQPITIGGVIMGVRDNLLTRADELRQKAVELRSQAQNLAMSATALQAQADGLEAQAQAAEADAEALTTLDQMADELAEGL